MSQPPTTPRTGSRPRLVTYRAIVTRVRHVGPQFVRVTLGGPEMRNYETGETAARVKVFVPTDPDADPVAPTLPPSSFEFPAGADAPVARTYTVRAHRPESGEIDIDFVVHPNGPGGRWAAGARVGDVITISHGVGQSLPGGIRDLLLVGDPSSLPAIMTILHSADPSIARRVLLLADGPSDVLPLEPAARDCGRWLYPNGASNAGTALADAVRGELSARHPDYVWVAGEATTLIQVRRVLRDDGAYTKATSKIAGYWRRSSTADEFERDTYARMRALVDGGIEPTEQDLEELSVPGSG
ncbi:siderophore-interacting protein [Nocardia sp. FBN12]|uniref:siderophore-interacting protein n=1 Tax=Nocardia sp. FBN12 TaxID=3419766 RepID=UPI003D0134BF